MPEYHRAWSRTKRRAYGQYYDAVVDEPQQKARRTCNGLQKRRSGLSAADARGKTQIGKRVSVSRQLSVYFIIVIISTIRVSPRSSAAELFNRQPSFRIRYKTSIRPASRFRTSRTSKPRSSARHTRCKTSRSFRWPHHTSDNWLS